MAPSKTGNAGNMPATPRKRSKPDDDAAEGADGPTKSAGTTPKKARVRSPKKVVKAEDKYQALQSLLGDAAPVTALSEVGAQAQLNEEKTAYELVIKLTSPMAFRYETSAKSQDTEMTFVVKTAQPFPFDRLPNEVKLSIIGHVLNPGGIPGNKIAISTKKDTLDSNGYSEDLKDRLGILRVNKAIYEMARETLYSNHFKFDDLGTMMTFLSSKSIEIKKSMTVIEVVAYKKTIAQAALSLLADCSALRKVHLSTGINANATPQNAAKAFFKDAKFWLHKLSQIKGKDGIFGVLRFGSSEKCFGIKQEGTVRAWTREERGQFQQSLAKLLG